MSRLRNKLWRHHGEEWKAMEVVLLKDIKRLGKAGDVRNVADGYARNYLIPRGLVAPATAGLVREAREHTAAQARRSAQEQAEAQTLAEQLADVSLEFTARAGETGRLYGSITAGDIAEALEKQTGLAVDRRKIMLEEPIRELGAYRIAIRFSGDVQAEVRVTVKPEE